MSQFSPYVVQDRRFKGDVFPFLIADEIGRQWYDGSPAQEMPERLWCRRHIRPGFTIVDCGAHHGMMSVLFGRWTGPTGQVIAYEALPENAAVIARNAALNGLHNVRARDVGVGEREATVTVALNQGNVMVGAAGDETVRIVTLDQDLPPGLRVDFLKLDVEGSELAALRGAGRVLAQRPVVDLELHNFCFADRPGTLAEIFALLHPAFWRYEVLGEVFGELVSVRGALDLDWLAQFDNPHVFCLPRKGQMVRRLIRWAGWR